MRQNSLQLVVSAIIGAQICAGMRRSISHLIHHHIFINAHIKVHIYAPSENEKESYFTSFGSSNFLLTCGVREESRNSRDVATHGEDGRGCEVLPSAAVSLAFCPPCP